MTYRYHKPDGSIEHRELTVEQQSAIDEWIKTENAKRVDRGQDPLPAEITVIDFFESR